MKFECIDTDTGLLYKDLVIIDECDFNLFPTIVCQISHGELVPEMTNTIMTSRYRNLYKIHNFKIIWRNCDR
jgi:hypothetical protein